jgi:hypothetical protein
MWKYSAKRWQDAGSETFNNCYRRSTRLTPQLPGTLCGGYVPVIYYYALWVSPE